MKAVTLPDSWFSTINSQQHENSPIVFYLDFHIIKLVKLVCYRISKDI